MQKISRKRAFSLVELLVVMTILLILASLTFFGVRSGVKRSKEAVSLSNLSQIGKAVLIYASQHDDWFPPYLSHASIGFITRKGQIPNFGAKFWVDSMEPYLGSKEILFSPLDPYKGIHPPDSALFSFASRPFMSYEHTLWPGVKGSPGIFRISQTSVEDPADTEYMWESGIKKIKYKDYMIEVPMAESTLGFLYLDGHVKRVPWSPAIYGFD